MLLYLNNGSFEGSEKFPDESVICQVLVKAKDGLGLMVYAEQLDLRKEETEYEILSTMRAVIMIILLQRGLGEAEMRRLYRVR